MVTTSAQAQPVENGTLVHNFASNRQEINGSLNSMLASVNSTLAIISTIANVTNPKNDDDVRLDSALSSSIGNRCSLCSWVQF